MLPLRVFEIGRHFRREHKSVAFLNAEAAMGLP
jgi:hypothetical protein